MDDSPRAIRLSSRVRGVIITALIAGYGWAFHHAELRARVAQALKEAVKRYS